MTLIESISRSFTKAFFPSKKESTSECTTEGLFILKR